MKERPILFSGPMVRAILEGRKTQTRRVIKPQPVGSNYRIDLKKPVCPYGRPGDRLWVRETFVRFDRSHWPPKYGYKADTLGPGFEESEQARKDLGYKWRPSIFMPRAASRLDLEVLGVRVERIQEISSEGAMDEGVYKKIDQPANNFLPIPAFRELWDSINAKRGFAWESNPWVWVVDFRKL